MPKEPYQKRGEAIILALDFKLHLLLKSPGKSAP